MRNIEIWRNELFDEIRTIANPMALQKLWSGSDPCSISSFEEEVAHVFDDYDIDGFIAHGLVVSKLNSMQFSSLCKFRDIFSAYVDEVASIRSASIDYVAILADPRWREVMSAAFEFVELLDAG